MMGCDEDAGRTVFEIQGVEHRRCPYFYVTSEIRIFLEYYGHYKAGFLPEAGGIADQPASFLAAAAFFSSEVAGIYERRKNS